MGRFLNPDNTAFYKERHSAIYVDKTGIGKYTNQVLDTTDAFICNSRPRRFGKSYAADMLSAYYSRGCDSRELFQGLELSESPDFDRYRNQCDVVHLDVQWCMMDAGGPDKVIDYMNRQVVREMKEQYPGVIPDEVTTIYGAMSSVNEALGNRFVVIMDEWDVLIRDESQDTKIQEDYINFLRGMFKGTEPSKYIMLAWLTGILPIKKVKTQSALNNFHEFTMIYPGKLSPYFGFTDEEVRNLCGHYHQDYEKVRQWYNGYLLGGIHVYNPRAVVSVMQTGEFRSYWSDTGSYEAILPLINQNFDGLKTGIIEMLSGNPVPVNVRSFRNDLTHFKNRDDILTYLIHLGYLGYQQDSGKSFVPNEEIREELTTATEVSKWDEFYRFEEESENILNATLDQDAGEVAAGVGRIHDEYASAIAYHNESSLSGVLTIAYLSSMHYYFKPIREMPTGRGFADFVYLPKPEFRSDYPALIVELKWNRNAQTAIGQIREKKYPVSIQAYSGDILLVGINYDRKTKEHTCLIEKGEIKAD